MILTGVSYQNQQVIDRYRQPRSAEESDGVAGREYNDYQQKNKQLASQQGARRCQFSNHAVNDHEIRKTAAKRNQQILDSADQLLS